MKYIFFLLICITTACSGPSSDTTQTDTTAVEQPSTEINKSDAPDTATAATNKPDTILVIGQNVYNQYCLACHQSNGSGVPGMYPPLAKSDWVQGDKTRLINVLLNGLSGEIQVNGEKYNQVMPPHNFLKDEEIAATLTYVRQSFGNQGDAVSIEEVAKLRNAKSK